MDAINHWFEQGHRAWETGDIRAAFRAFLHGAKVGDVSCQQNVGYFYDEGLVVRKNRRKAIHWYMKSASGGSSSAAYNLGLIFERQRNYSAAAGWFKQALQLGESDAEVKLLNLGKTENSENSDIRFPKKPLKQRGRLMVWTPPTLNDGI